MIVLRRKLLAIILLAFGTSAEAASPRDDAFAGISRCSTVQDDRKLLDCIYGAAQPLRAELGLTPAPEFQTKLVPSGPSHTSQIAVVTPPLRKESFLHRLIGEDPIAETAVRITSYSFDRRGLFTVTLDNGEIWGQLADDAGRAEWRWPAREHYVSIQGDVSAATLEVTSETGSFRVQRLH